MGTHLGLSPEERHEQVQRIIDVLPYDDRLILAGDFNFELNTQNYLGIVKYLRDGLMVLDQAPASTFPADHPDRRIDYIFIGKNIEVVKSAGFYYSEIISASDHQPQTLHFR